MQHLLATALDAPTGKLPLDSDVPTGSAAPAAALRAAQSLAATERLRAAKSPGGD